MPKYVISTVPDSDFYAEVLYSLRNKSYSENCVIEKSSLTNFLIGKIENSTVMDFLPEDVVPKSEVDSGVLRFSDSPVFIDVPFAQWKKFKSEISRLTLGFPGSGFKMGLRFYIGRASKNQDAKYSIVVVPMYVPVSSTGIFDRTNEKEVKLFTDAGVPFFGLLVSDSEQAHTTDKTKCSDSIKVIDPRDRAVAFFTLEGIDLFINSLDPTKDPAIVRFDFIRTTNGIASFALSCRTSGNIEITSNLPIKGPAQAVYFDQGDLIPPPPNDTMGLRDTHFPR